VSSCISNRLTLLLRAGAGRMLGCHAPRTTCCVFAPVSGGQTAKLLITLKPSLNIMHIMRLSSRFRGRRPPPSPKPPATSYSDMTGAENTHFV
jgi:hypothetical protein